MADHIRLLEHEYDDITQALDDRVLPLCHNEDCLCECGELYGGLDDSRHRLTELVEQLGRIYLAAIERAR